MLEVLMRAGCFVGIIFIGWLLRTLGFFKEEDFHVLSKIVLKITLPAAIISSFAEKEISPDMLAISLLGLGFGVLYIGVAYLLAAGKSRESQAFEVLNISGYNIGNFTMPFAQSFLGPVGIITTSLFDSGNAFICLGGSYSMAALLRNGQRFSLKSLIKNLLHSVPLHLLHHRRVLFPGPHSHARVCGGILRNNRRRQRFHGHAHAGGRL